jgi:RIO-like serine/threonine protein kinase
MTKEISTIILEELIFGHYSYQEGEALVTLSSFRHLEDDIPVFHYVSLEDFAKSHKASVDECKYMLERLFQKELVNKDQEERYQYKLDLCKLKQDSLMPKCCG